MAAPLARLRKQLSAPGLLKTVRQCFEAIEEHRRRRGTFSLADVLMSGLAMFGLKYPSLLKFDEAHREEAVVRANLKSLYGVEQAPCDTQMRSVLDPLDPAALRPAFATLHRQLQRQGALKAYRYLDGYYLLSVDGTGQFGSTEISCPECCVKMIGGEEHYYHQLLGAVLVHPGLKTVLPLAPEPITRGDGQTKNDCERNAAKRLLANIRADHPQLKLIVIEDALAANAPHLRLLQQLDMRFIINVKEGDHRALFETVRTAMCQGRTEEWSYVDERGIEHGYRWLNDVPLNQSHPDLRVNFLEYWEIKDEQERLLCGWMTDIPLSRDNVAAVARGGRSRWKIENETFNTLKNQGYRLEHNYGHGEQHLATVLAMLMMLAFLIDQIQELGCRLFQAARARFHSRTSLWERLRALFVGFSIPDWQTLWQAIARGHTAPLLQPDTS